MPIKKTLSELKFDAAKRSCVVVLKRLCPVQILIETNRYDQLVEKAKRNPCQVVLTRLSKSDMEKYMNCGEKDRRVLRSRNRPVSTSKPKKLSSLRISKPVNKGHARSPRRRAAAVKIEPNEEKLQEEKAKVSLIIQVTTVDSSSAENEPIGHKPSEELVDFGKEASSALYGTMPIDLPGNLDIDTVIDYVTPSSDEKLDDSLPEVGMGEIIKLIEVQEAQADPAKVSEVANVGNKTDMGSVAIPEMAACVFAAATEKVKSTSRKTDVRVGLNDLTLEGISFKEPGIIISGQSGTYSENPTSSKCGSSDAASITGEGEVFGSMPDQNAGGSSMPMTSTPMKVGFSVEDPRTVDMDGPKRKSVSSDLMDVQSSSEIDSEQSSFDSSSAIDSESSKCLSSGYQNNLGVPDQSVCQSKTRSDEDLVPLSNVKSTDDDFESLSLE